MKKVLFVCMGNICRSPTAEAVFSKLVSRKEWHVDSAGTHAYHVGNPPDKRSQRAAKTRGYEMAHLRARQVSTEDFELFGWILAADRENLRNLKALAPAHYRAQLGLIQDFSLNPKWQQQDVPDPYYGGEQGFDEVLDRIESACKGFLEKHN